MMERRPGGWVLLSDFDGTVTEVDMCLALLTEYAEGDWLSLDLAYDEGRISLEECLLGQVPMLSRSAAEMVAYARREARVRPGLEELVAYCRERGVGFEVVSAGLDFYIDAILAREGLADVAVTYIRTRPEGERLTVELPLGGYAPEEGIVDFKEAIVRDHHARGLNVAFVGDGSTDFAAGRRADHVFARAKLLTVCRQEGLSHTPFEDFHDVRTGLESLLAGEGDQVARS